MFVIFKSVEQGETENWINLIGSTNFHNDDVMFKYCGTELHPTVAMAEDAKNKLLEKMKKKLGYSPFDLDVLKKKVINLKLEF